MGNLVLDRLGFRLIPRMLHFAFYLSDTWSLFRYSRIFFARICIPSACEAHRHVGFKCQLWTSRINIRLSLSFSVHPCDVSAATVYMAIWKCTVDIPRQKRNFIIYIYKYIHELLNILYMFFSFLLCSSVYRFAYFIVFYFYLGLDDRKCQDKKWKQAKAGSNQVLGNAVWLWGVWLRNVRWANQMWSEHVTSLSELLPTCIFICLFMYLLFVHSFLMPSFRSFVFITHLYFYAPVVFSFSRACNRIEYEFVTETALF